jgi:hypothetical protein
MNRLRYVVNSLIQAIALSVLVFGAKQEHPCKLTTPGEAAVVSFMMSLMFSHVIWRMFKDLHGVPDECNEAPNPLKETR